VLKFAKTAPKTNENCECEIYCVNSDVHSHAMCVGLL